MFAGSGVILDADACRHLYSLAVKGLAVIRDRDGVGTVPASTADLLRVLRAGSRVLADVQPVSTAAWVTGAVPETGLEQERDWFSVNEAAAAWGCTPSYVRRLCRLGDVEGIKTEDGGWRLLAEYVRAQDGPPRPQRKEMEIDHGRSNSRGDAAA